MFSVLRSLCSQTRSVDIVLLIAITGLSANKFGIYIYAANKFGIYIYTDSNPVTYNPVEGGGGGNLAKQNKKLAYILTM